MNDNSNKSTNRGEFFRITWALFVARGKEYYRDRGSLLWALLFPVCIVAAISFAFSDDDQVLLRIGVFEPSSPIEEAVTNASPTASTGLPALDPATASLLAQPFVDRIDYTDLEQGLQRLRYHQLDLLLSSREPGRYWVNELSSKGRAAERLFLAKGERELQRTTVTGNQVRYVDWVIPGILGMNVMFGALFGIGFVIVRYRKNGVLKRLQVTPVTRLQFLIAQVVSRLLVLVAGAAIVYVGCDLFLGFVMLGNYLNLIVVAVLGIFAMIAMALIVASRTSSEELANGLLNFAAFPMMLLSEVWFSLDGAPDWLVAVSQCLPLTHLVQAARAIMIEGAGLADISHHLWVLVVMSAVFLWVAAWLFRWNQP